MKICSCCHIEKDNSQFSRHSMQCKDCKRTKRKEYKLKNKERLKIERHIYNHSFNGRLVALIQAAKQRAQDHNLIFSLDKEWILEQYEKQNGTCLLTGIKFNTDKFEEARLNPFSPSLDKIIPKLGYTKENTRLVCVAINLALNEFGEKIFKQICGAYLLKKSL